LISALAVDLTYPNSQPSNDHAGGTEHLQKQIDLMVDRIEKATDKWENATLRLGQKEHERGGCVQRTSRSEPKAHLSVVWKSMR
jgi:hypothetical protein